MNYVSHMLAPHCGVILNAPLAHQRSQIKHSNHEHSDIACIVKVILVLNEK